jgi:phenylacetate-CoA ligase
VGPNKELFLKSLKKFGGFYDQVLLMGYPPFLKDIIDEAPDYGISWNDYTVKILTATEAFSEEFRDYIAKKTGVKNIYTDIVNIYGTVELGTMAHETALTTLIRRIAVKNQMVFKAVFGAIERLPTLAQYYPHLVYFEEKDGEILGSGYGSAMPLLRYRFPDRGGVVTFSEMTKRLASAGIDIGREIKKEGLNESIPRLPFVYVYERSDMATTLFGINIYPEYIKHALEDKTVTGFITGKFTMLTRADKRQNQYLEINTEVKGEVKPNAKLARAILKLVIKSLVEKSTEYNYLYGNSAPKYKKRLEPQIILWPYEDPAYFKPGGKQKWSIKPSKNQ